MSSATSIDPIESTNESGSPATTGQTTIGSLEACMTLFGLVLQQACQAGSCTDCSSPCENDEDVDCDGHCWSVMDRMEIFCPNAFDEVEVSAQTVSECMSDIDEGACSYSVLCSPDQNNCSDACDELNFFAPCNADETCQIWLCG